MLGTQANVTLFQSLEGTYSQHYLYVAHRQQLGKAIQDEDSILYEEYVEHTISILLLFPIYSVLCGRIQELSEPVYRTARRLSFGPWFALLYALRWLYTTDIVYTLYSQHSVCGTVRC